MSLDYAFVACQQLPTSLAELQEDPSYDRARYKVLAEEMFPQIKWQADGTGLAIDGQSSFEVNLSDVSLSLSARGSNDLSPHIEAAALVALRHSVVTIDIQCSELFVPEACGARAEYTDWYRAVVYGEGP